MILVRKLWASFDAGNNAAMEYKLRIPKGTVSVIPLAVVANVMAEAVATSGGKLPFHMPTYRASYAQYSADLLDAARYDHLTVCDSRGIVGTANDILAAAEKAGFATLNEDGTIDLNATRLLHLYTTVSLLGEWRKHLGDQFILVELPVRVVERDLTNENGKIIEAGHYRGYAWADNWPEQGRRERVIRRVRELKANGAKNFIKQTAKEEGISESYVKQIVSPPKKKNDADSDDTWMAGRDTRSRK